MDGAVAAEMEDETLVWLKEATRGRGGGACGGGKEKKAATGGEVQSGITGNRLQAGYLEALLNNEQ